MPGATDNYTGNLGSGGESYASDSIASVQYPRVKMTWGVDGTAADVSATNPMPVSGTFFQATQPVTFAASTLMVTATAAVNTAVTATLPAPAAGLFIYITSIQVMKLYSVLGVASGAGVIITSTNLPGTPAWTTQQAAGAVGTVVDVVDFVPDAPLRSAAAATAVTIVAPAQLQTIWRINVSYYTAA